MDSLENVREVMALPAILPLARFIFNKCLCPLDSILGQMNFLFFWSLVSPFKLSLFICCCRPFVCLAPCEK